MSNVFIVETEPDYDESSYITEVVNDLSQLSEETAKLTMYSGRGRPPTEFLDVTEWDPSTSRPVNKWIYDGEWHYTAIPPSDTDFSTWEPDTWHPPLKGNGSLR